MKKIKNSLPPDAKVDLWTTTIVISILELKFSSYKDEWIIMVNKAKKHLDTNKVNYYQEAIKFLNDSK